MAEDSSESLALTGVRPATLEAVLTELPPYAQVQAKLFGFKAAAGKTLLIPDETGALTGALIGLGDGPALHGFGAAATSLPPGSVWHITPGDYEAGEAALGFLLGAYKFDRLTSKKSTPALLAPDAVPPRARIVSESIQLARDLINTPANLLGPAELADSVIRVAEECGARVERINGVALDARYPAISAAGAGSERKPEVVVLEWQGAGASADSPLVSLCGKGVCFDTGGYDLKPSAAMLRMKKDMGGAAIMLGLARAIMLLNLKIRLQLRIGCIENSVSGHAMRPSDILTTRAGLTVEIGNTDAEGRLVLCDLLTEASEHKPSWLIDAATLTGAARVALGPDLPALFCNDDAMALKILQAGLAENDPLWRLPIHDGYSSWLESPIADLANVSSKPFAGAIIAAIFLKKFVLDSISWAHIDVYAWNDSTRPGRPEGGEAQTLRALITAIEHLQG